MSFEEKSSNIIYKILWASFIIFALGTAISISLEELGAFLAIFIFGILLVSKKTKIQHSIIDIPIILLVFGFILSSLFTSHKISSLIDNVHDLWMILLFYVLVSSLNIEKYRKILKVVLWVSLFAALYGIFQSLSGIDFIKHRNLYKEGNLFYATGLWGLHLTYGGFMAMITPVFLGLFFSTEKWGKNKYFFLSGFILTLIATFFSFSRSAVVGLFAGFIFIAIINIKKTYKIFIIFSLLVLILFLLSPTVKKRMQTITSIKYLKSIPRYEFILTSLVMIKHNLILGIGSGNYTASYKKYKPEGFRFGGHDHPHNDIINMYLLGGVLGFLGYLLLFGLVIIQGTKLYFRGKENFLLLGLLSSVVTMFFQGLSQCYFTDAENAWLFWFLLSGILIFIHNKNIHYVGKNK